MAYFRFAARIFFTLCVDYKRPIVNLMFDRCNIPNQRMRANTTGRIHTNFPLRPMTQTKDFPVCGSWLLTCTFKSRSHRRGYIDSTPPSKSASGTHILYTKIEWPSLCFSTEWLRHECTRRKKHTVNVSVDRFRDCHSSYIIRERVG